MKSLIKVALLCVLATAVFAQEPAPAGPPPGGDMGAPPEAGGAPPPPDANGAPPPPPDEMAPVAAPSDAAPTNASPAPKQDNSSAAAPQQPEPGQGRERGMRRGRMRGVMGEITAVNPNGFTVKTMQGNSATVKVSSETKFQREQQAIKMSDLKVGDTIRVGGTPDANDPTTWNASFVSDVTAQVKQFEQNLGKTMIAGEVKSIDGTKLTILRPDGQTQTIEADENTSFHRGRESVTLADIKAGDHVMGRGSVKDGVFVPSELRVGGMGMGMGMGAGGGNGWRGRGQGQGQGQGGSQNQSNPPQ